MVFLYDIDTHLGLNVVLLFAIVILTGVLGYFVVRSIIKERKKFREEAINYIDGLIQKNELIADVTTYISRSSAAEFSLIYIDIDKFSNVIEAFGKDESDNILTKIAYKLVDALPPRVELARIQDDKFVAFARGEYSKDEVEEIAKNLLETVRQPIKFFGDNELNVTASIGVALYPTHGVTYKSLIADAEIAVYMCKREGGNDYKFYSLENMSESANLAYYQQIKKGMKNKEFCLYYQPMIDCVNKKVYAVEGLLRWNHPEFGLLSPYKFINIMEQTGDINWVGQWGLETLAKELSHIIKKYPDDNIMMSMNLSPKQLTSPTLIENFNNIVKKAKVSPKNIILEIEEFTLFEKHEAIKQNITNLSKIGFRIAVDGLGLDYTTLSKLEAMPIDVVKVDNDFLDNETDTILKEKFVKMLVDYTRSEEKTIVSEGIENALMMEKALNMDLGMMQGYYFAKPMDKDGLEEYLDQRKWMECFEAKKKVVEEIVEEPKEVEETNVVDEAVEVQEEVKQVEATEEVKQEETTEETKVETTEEAQAEAPKKRSKKTKKTEDTKVEEPKAEEKVEETLE